MRLALLTLAPVLVLGTAATVSAGAVESRDLTLPPFEAIVAGGNFAVQSTSGKAQTVRIAADPETLARVLAKVENKVLRLSLKEESPGIWFKRGSRDRTEVAVNIPSLRSADLSGACTITASGLSGAAFKLSLSGASQATLKGKVRELQADLSGASRVDARQLETQATDLDLSGASNAKVHASTSLKVSSSGASQVEYKGNPKIQQDVSGVAKINRLP